MRLLRRFLLNGALVAASLLLTALVLEFPVFRWWLPAPDLPRLDFVDGVVKYAPHQQGVFRLRDEIEARFRINADGWNSTHDHYRFPADTVPGGRIAVIGDSYVEALQVDVEQSFASVLEAGLGAGYRVHRYGISGAPLSQYLHLLRREVVLGKPDLVIALLVHNDFDESYRRVPGVYTSSFLKLRLDDEGRAVVEEVAPRALARPWYAPIRRFSATWRYLRYRQQLRFGLLRRWLLGEPPPEYRANVNLGRLADSRLADEAVTDHVFGEFAALAGTHGFQVLVVMDGDREAIYRGEDADTSRVLDLNRLAARQAAAHGLAFLDLHPVFQEDFRQHGRRFNFIHDGHWNRYGHQRAAEAMLRWLADSAG